MFEKVAFIWDIDGVVVDSPHEDAWRITAAKEPYLVKTMGSDFYFNFVASRPRFEGGNNILELNNVYDRLGAKTKEEKKVILERYCSEKNKLINNLIEAGKFNLFPDAVLTLWEAKRKGIPQAAASASKNAKDMLIRVTKERLIKEIGPVFNTMDEGNTLYKLFDIDVCGTDLEGKKNILEFASSRIKELMPGEKLRFVVFEDASSGIEAAKSLGFDAVGVWRIGQEEALRRAGADFVARDLRTADIYKFIGLV
jgi:beta-phosphoglucomutase-like phosphatase (HAD superfamily)